jgi:hypothetical protein
LGDQVLAQPNATLAQLLDQRCDCIYFAHLFRLQEDTQSSGQSHSKSLGVPSCQPLVDYHEIGLLLLCQGNYLGFTPLQVGNQGGAARIPERNNVHPGCFSELTDPEEQRRRFEGDNRKRVSAGKNACLLPVKFLESLRHLPDSAGIALGVDRLAMIICDAASVDEVVTFTPEEL